MRLKVNIIGFEMPMHTTHVLKMSVIVNTVNFEMLMYTTRTENVCV